MGAASSALWLTQQQRHEPREPPYVATTFVHPVVGLPETVERQKQKQKQKPSVGGRNLRETRPGTGVRKRKG
ncbi:hypothetical protein HBI23_245940 [Parastagonospora nodorum]|nr:hypothetical protein HBI23_245940 [Parastagonospora nodorum]KAH5983722.1 hypothetical protein HBI84_244670 [Parastagonospora nodorum]